MSYNQGSLVLVPFPFTDLSGTKQRPALVVSPDWFNQSYKDIVLTAVTASVSMPQDFSEVALVQKDLSVGNLPKDSVIKTTKLFTCEASMVVKEIAKVKQEKLTQVLEILRDFFREA